MKIKNIKINSYGNLKQKEINLNNNFNIIFGKNESGKSTLLNCLKSTFYGISKNKNGKAISDYEKYSPWVGEEFSGKIKYELDNGKSFEVYRDFHKRNPSIIDENLNDISNEFKIDKKDGNQFFYEQTGVDEKTYASTIMSAQQEVMLDKTTQNVLVQKVANLAGTGDDKISFKKAIERINKRLVEEIGTSRTQDRPLNIVQNRIKELGFDLKSKKSLDEIKQNLETNKTNLEQRLQEEKNRNKAMSELNMLTRQYEIELEKNNLKNKIKDENEKKIKDIIDKKEQLINTDLQIDKKSEVDFQEKKLYNKNNNCKFEKNKINNFNNKLNNEKNKIKKINYSAFLIILFLLIIINILNFIFIKNKLINYILLSFIPIEIILFIFNYLNNKKLIKKIEKENSEKKEIEKKLEEQLIVLNTQINLLRENTKQINEEIEKEKSQINFQFNYEKGKIIKKYFNNINELQYNIEDKNKLQKEIEISNKKIMNYQLELNNIAHEENNIDKQIEELISMQEEYEQLLEKLEILEQKNKCIQATKELLEKAYEKMKNNVTPKFTQNLSNIAQNISNGKYKKVALNEEKGLIVENENGEYISANLLSVGTIDQLYLSLRLSMLDEISEEKLPIILDEPFAYFDDERLKNILMFLKQKSEEHQIIILSCSKREKQILNELNMEYNWVEI